MNLVESHSHVAIAFKVYAALALSLQALGQNERAEENLKRLFKSSSYEDSRSQAAASLNLGIM